MAVRRVPLAADRTKKRIILTRARGLRRGLRFVRVVTCRRASQASWARQTEPCGAFAEVVSGSGPTAWPKALHHVDAPVLMNRLPSMLIGSSVRTIDMELTHGRVAQLLVQSPSRRRVNGVRVKTEILDPHRHADGLGALDERRGYPLPPVLIGYEQIDHVGAERASDEPMDVGLVLK